MNIVKQWLADSAEAVPFGAVFVRYLEYLKDNPNATPRAAFEAAYEQARNEALVAAYIVVDADPDNRDKSANEKLRLAKAAITRERVA